MVFPSAQFDRAHLLDRHVDPSPAEPKIEGQNTDHGAIHGVEGQAPAEDVRVGCEALFPKAVAQHHRTDSALAVFFRQKPAAQEWGYAESGEDARRHVLTRHLLGFAASGEVEVIAAVDAHIGEGTASAAPIEVIRIGDRGLAELRCGLEDIQQLVGIGIRKRPQQYAVYHAENGCIRPDAERQGQHRNGGEAGTLPQRPESVAKVLPEAGQEASFVSRAQDDGLRRAGALDGFEFSGQQFVAADFFEGDAAGFRLRIPAGFELPVTIFGVLGQLLDDLRLAGRSESQVRQLLANLFLPVRHFRLR